MRLPNLLATKNGRLMAFFLLMWLLGSTSKGDLQGIADYFQNPLKVSMAGGSDSPERVDTLGTDR